MGGLRDWKGLEWLPTALAALALAVFVAAFLHELFAYQRMVAAWAMGDLNSRARLAAAHLAEPLRTQDLTAIRRVGASCEADGVHLVVTSSRGGTVFDSCPPDVHDALLSSERCPSGDCWVSVGMPQRHVLAPFKKALGGFLLAALVGVTGVLLFFFVTYRQRVRIRELKRLEAFRREFIADVSHEIKTPLTGILGAIDLMSGESPLVPLIQREAKRLNGLVQSILDLARLERDGERIDPVETDLVGLVRESVDLLRPVAQAAHVELAFSAPTEGVVPVLADPQLLAQAVSNLVANAIRHSGSPDVSVSVDVGGHEVRVAVEDRGVGIPAEEAERVFERFHRIDPARTAETGGAGLGLAIVRRIARLHGGDVALEHVRPHGCRFVLRLKSVRGMARGLGADWRTRARSRARRDFDRHGRGRA